MAPASSIGSVLICLLVGLWAGVIGWASYHLESIPVVIATKCRGPTIPECIVISRIASNPQELCASINSGHFFRRYGPKDYVDGTLNVLGEYGHTLQIKTPGWSDVGGETALDLGYTKRSQIIRWCVPGICKDYLNGWGVPNLKLQFARPYDFCFNLINHFGLEKTGTLCANVGSIRDDKRFFVVVYGLLRCYPLLSGIVSIDAGGSSDKHGRYCYDGVSNSDVAEKLLPKHWHRRLLFACGVIFVAVGILGAMVWPIFANFRRYGFVWFVLGYVFAAFFVALGFHLIDSGLTILDSTVSWPNVDTEHSKCRILVKKNSN